MGELERHIDLVAAVLTTVGWPTIGTEEDGVTADSILAEWLKMRKLVTRQLVQEMVEDAGALPHG